SRICSRQRRNAERLSRSLSRIFSPYLQLHTTKNKSRPTTNQRCWRVAWRGGAGVHTASMTWLPCLRAERVRGAHQDRRATVAVRGIGDKASHGTVGSGQRAVGGEERQDRPPVFPRSANYLLPPTARFAIIGIC